MTKKIYLGKIVGAHGVRGLFKIKFYNKEFSNFYEYKHKLHVDNIKINLEKKFSKGNLTICKSKKINSKNELFDLIGKEVWIDETDLEYNNPNYHYHKDLIGSKVYDKNCNLLGTVIAIHNFGAGDILELDGQFKYMIKFDNSSIKDIDKKNKIIKLSENYG